MRCGTHRTFMSSIAPHDATIIQLNRNTPLSTLFTAIPHGVDHGALLRTEPAFSAQIFRRLGAPLPSHLTAVRWLPGSNRELTRGGGSLDLRHPKLAGSLEHQLMRVVRQYMFLGNTYFKFRNFAPYSPPVAIQGDLSPSLTRQRIEHRDGSTRTAKETRTVTGALRLTRSIG